MNFTEKLSYLIKKEGMTRKQFAEAVGISYSTIDNWYKRSYENMSVTSLSVICRFFDVTMESMVYDDMEIRQVNHDSLKIGPHDLDLVNKYRELDARGKSNVSDTIFREYDYLKKTDRLA